jgi:hypothetical protein
LHDLSFSAALKMFLGIDNIHVPLGRRRARAAAMQFTMQQGHAFRVFE